MYMHVTCGLCCAGITVLGYVDTNYTSRNVTLVQHDVAK